MEREVRPGEFYRHFKNKLYQIVTVAIHSETGEQMVVYQALYGDYRTYVRPLSMFLSEVDHDKYPGVVQQYRFERVVPERGSVRQEDILADEGDPFAVKDLPPQPPEREINPDLIRFLEAENYEERAAALSEMEKTAGQTELDSIYVAMDMSPQTGTVREQIENIRLCLKMQEHYDGGHLR